jgi:hypothetical protein
MITLSSHTLHALQLLDGSCFKPFTTTFKKGKGCNYVPRNNHMEPNNITLVGWVDQALEQSLTKKTSSMGLRYVYMAFEPKGNGK